MQIWKWLFSSSPYMPHGYCYLWDPALVRLHVVSDILIALSYLSIPFTLGYFVRKRRDLPFHWMFLCFGVFILACGATHGMEVWTLWHADYWASGVVKAITAIASVPTAILLAKLIPQAIALPSPAAMRLEIAERKRAEEALSLTRTDVHLNVTWRRETAEALRRSEERFRLLVEGIADYAIFMLDPAGFVSSWNPGAERIKGYRAQEIIGRHFSCFYGDEDLCQGRPALALREAAVHGRCEEDGWRLRKDGSRFRANTTLTALVDQHGELIGFAKITRDLTRSRRAEEALLTAQAELARVVRASSLGELTASIAHEINQPLAAIVNNANASRRLLAEPEPDLEEVRQAVDDIAEAGARAGEIISRVRTLLKKTPPERSPLCINQVIQEVLSLLSGSIERQQVLVETELLASPPPVLGDRVQLQQVLVNLLMNGIEAMHGVHGRQRVLRIRSDAHASRVEVIVRDSGMGLDPLHIPHIFDTFFTTKASGMGMGLSISRSIIEAHSGRLYASPNPAGDGATFHFSLPAAG